MEVGIVLPGEADAPEHLDAFLGAVGVPVEGQRTGSSRSQGGSVTVAGSQRQGASQATAVICSILMAMSANRCLMAWNWPMGRPN